jgi:hypothetical protein
VDVAYDHLNGAMREGVLVVNDEQDLVTRAEEVLGQDERVVAAGIFGLQDSTETSIAAMAGAAVGSAVLDSPVTAGIGSAATVHATRHAVAAAHGLTVRMLVAVTGSHIHLLDWRTGSGPSRELVSFPRASTDVRVGRYGLSRRVSLHEVQSDTSVDLTGTTAFFASEAKGDRAVLRTLQQAS